MNLFSNALKFTKSGEIIFGVYISLNGSTNHQLQFMVKDTGVGIPTNRLQTIFNLFEANDTESIWNKAKQEKCNFEA